MQLHSRKLIAYWLALLATMVVCIVVIGGITRLTQSGLSMVEWRPIMGVIPPTSEHQWAEAFHKYQQFPEYQIVNPELDLDGFKYIFYWEYFHRILGRLMGLVFFFPFMFFLIRGDLNSKWIKKLIIGGLLGGSQGLLGWYMVKSGLVNVPHVSHYRLAAHLSLAFVIFGYLLWLILDLRCTKSSPEGAVKNLFFFSTAITTLICIQVVYGAFVAGRHAGLGFNTFPMMGNDWIPSGILSLKPMWENFVGNNITLQFIHRSLGILILFAVFVFWLLARTKSQLRSAANLLLTSVLLQFLLGVSTLVLVVPIPLAVLHQAGGLLLFGAAILVNHSASPVSSALNT